METHLAGRVLRAAVLAGLACLAGCADGGDGFCYRSIEVEATLAPPLDPPMYLRVESCRVDPDACRDVCSMVLRRRDVVVAPSACAVAFDGDQIDVAVAYLEESNPQACEQLGGFLEDHP